MLIAEGGRETNRDGTLNDIPGYGRAYRYGPRPYCEQRPRPADCRVESANGRVTQMSSPDDLRAGPRNRQTCGPRCGRQPTSRCAPAVNKQLVVWSGTDVHPQQVPKAQQVTLRLRPEPQQVTPGIAVAADATAAKQALIDPLLEMHMTKKRTPLCVRSRFVPARLVVCAALAVACAAAAAQSGPRLPPRTGEPLQRAQPPAAQPAETTPATHEGFNRVAPQATEVFKTIRLAGP